jgi:hypothetical protein
LWLSERDPRGRGHFRLITSESRVEKGHYWSFFVCIGPPQFQSLVVVAGMHGQDLTTGTFEILVEEKQPQLAYPRMDVCRTDSLGHGAGALSFTYRLGHNQRLIVGVGRFGLSFAVLAQGLLDALHAPLARDSLYVMPLAGFALFLETDHRAGRPS